MLAAPEYSRRGFCFGASVHYYRHEKGHFCGVSKIKELPLVYAVITPDFEYLKIGKTTNFRQRLSNIQSGCPFHLSLWLGIRTPAPSQIEEYLHDSMNHALVRGEWFAPSDQDLDFMFNFFSLTNKNVRETFNALL